MKMEGIIHSNEDTDPSVFDTRKLSKLVELAVAEGCFQGEKMNVKTFL